jgi:SAM-dependent methyltransferase
MIAESQASILPAETRDRLKTLLQCPNCRGPLEWKTSVVACVSCQSDFPIRNHCPNFTKEELIDSSDAEFQQERMYRWSLRSQLYDIGRRVITSEYAPRDHRTEFLAAIPTEAVVVEFGSGNRRLSAQIINIDLFPFPNVDLTADISKSPLADSSVDYIILDSVIEHVPDPQSVIAEVHRVLKPQGKLFCVNPFLFPYHGYPAHYCNFTRDGIRHLLRNFSSVVVEPHYGPTSAVTNILSEYVAISLAGERRTPYLILRAIMLFCIGWLRFLDRWLIRSSYAHRLSGMLCSVAQK